MVDAAGEPICRVPPGDRLSVVASDRGHRHLCRDGRSRSRPSLLTGAIPLRWWPNEARAPAGVAPTPRAVATAVRRLPALLRSGGGRRAGWGVADQMVSSLTNFSITLVVANQATPRQFGAFSVALALYIFLLWVARSVVAEPFVIRLTRATTAEQQAAARSALGAAVGLGVAAAALLLAGALAFRQAGGVLAVMALSMPGLLVQDAYRYVLIAAGRARAAAANDGLWLCLQAAATTILLVSDTATAVTLTAAFGAAGTAAALVAARQAGALPAVGSAQAWLRRHRDLGGPFVLELVAVNGMTHLTMVGIGVVGGIVAVGELRAAAVLMSPPTVLFAGAFLMGTAEAVRLRDQSRRRLSALVVALAVSTSLVTVAWAVALALVPDAVGRTLLESNWAAARHVLLPVAALTAANACILAGIVGLRALEAARESLRVRLWAAPAIVGAGLVGVAVGGAYGAGVGLAVGSAFSAALTWSAFRRALRTHVPVEGRPPEAGTVVPEVEIPTVNG